MRYKTCEEGELSAEHSAVVGDDIERERVEFREGDAAALALVVGPFEAVVASSLLCRCFCVGGGGIV